MTGAPLTSTMNSVARSFRRVRNHAIDMVLFCCKTSICTHNSAHAGHRTSSNAKLSCSIRTSQGGINLLDDQTAFP